MKWAYAGREIAEKLACVRREIATRWACARHDDGVELGRDPSALKVENYVANIGKASCGSLFAVRLA